MHRQAGDPVDIVITTDSTATAGDVARHIAASDPTRSIPVAEGDVLTLAVAPPTGDRLVPLQPDVPIGEAPIGSGFAASIVNYGPDYAVAGQREIVGVLRGHLGRTGRPGVPDCGGPRLPGSGGGQRRRPHRPHGLEASCAARSRHAHRGRRPELRERRTGGRCRGAARPGRGGRAVRDRRHHARAPPRALVRRLGDRGADHGARRRSAVQPQPSCGGALPGDPVQDPASAHGEDRQDVPLADPDRTDPGGDGAVRPERQSPFAPDHRDDAADGIRQHHQPGGAEQEGREPRDRPLRAAVRAARRGLLPRQARGGARAQRRGAARRGDLRSCDAARPDAVDATTGALELPRPPTRQLPAAGAQQHRRRRDTRRPPGLHRPCGPAPRSLRVRRRRPGVRDPRGCRVDRHRRATRSGGRHDARPRCAAVRPARPERRRRRGLRGFRLDARAGLAQVDAAHLQRQEPVPRPGARGFRADQRLAAEHPRGVRAARRRGGRRRRAPRAVQGGLEPPAVRHGRGSRSIRAQEHARPVGDRLRVQRRARRPWPPDGRAGARGGSWRARCVRLAHGRVAARRVPQLRRCHGGPRGRAGGSGAQRRELRARARGGCVERVHGDAGASASLRWWMRAPGCTTRPTSRRR